MLARLACGWRNHTFRLFLYFGRLGVENIAS